MNKTLLATSLILSLLGANLAKAETTDFIIPATAYSITSEAGSFTSIADNGNTVKFGADLTAGTKLVNGFFVNDNDNPFVTHAADKTKTDPGFELGFTFNFCGKPMTHFTVCASGGIFFGSGGNIPQGQSQSWHASFSGWDTIDLQNIITVITKDAGGNLNTAQSIAGKSPVMYLIEGETGAKVLTVQYDYAINGDEWIYQIKAYENGDVELVVGSLATANAGGNACRLFLGLVENGNYKVSDDAFGDNNLNITRAGETHYLGMTQTTASDWSTVAAYTNTFSVAPDGLFVKADNAPETGRTLAFKTPADCTEKAQKFGDDWYGFSTTNITKTSFAGKITFNKNNITPAQMTAAGTLIAVLSTSETPDYTLANGTWYQAGDQLDGNKILINAKPRYAIANDGTWNGNIYDLTFSASGLTAATTYYIHIYAMDYHCTGAPVYSDLCHTFSFQTSIDLPQTLSAGLPTTSSVPITVQPAEGEGFGVVLLKSPNTNALKLSGKLKAGDQIGDAEVLTVITSPNETVYDVQLQSGEGTYILAYSVVNPDAEAPVYGQDFLNLPVRAAYDGLPISLTFAGETFTTPLPTEYGRLPFGWTRETEFPASKRNQAFRLSTIADDDIIVCLKSSYPGTSNFTWTEWADVVTPAFALPAGKTRIAATFFISYSQEKGQNGATAYKPTNTDLIRIEYSVNGGAWQTALNIDGTDDDFPQLNAEGRYPLNVTMGGFATGDILRLRYSYQSPATGDNGTINTMIHAVEITEGKVCEQPRTFQLIDSLATTNQLVFRWTDNNLPAAPNYVLAYHADGENTWQYTRVTTGADRDEDAPINGLLSGLNAGTVYMVKVAALCNRTDTSFYTEPLTVRSAYGLPYEESMAKTGSGASAQTPFDRGVKTYTGVIGGRLEETTDAQPGWNQNKTSDPYDIANTVSVGDFVTNAWLMMPAVYILKNGAFTPKSLNFTLRSFDSDKNKGAAPNYSDTKLHVLVSGNGLFPQQSIVKTFEADELKLDGQDFTIDLSEREGYLQVAFVFECPSGAQNAADRPEPWYIEISQLRIRYDVDVCFPVENLERTLGVHDIPMTWDASASAVEYGIFWGVYGESGYSDSAFTKEPRYTIRSLKDGTRYKAMVIAYCSEDHSLAADPVRTSFYTLPGCHTPANFHVCDVYATGADFVSTSEQPDELTQRIVYITPENDDKTFAFIQESDTLQVRDSLTKLTAYTATTVAVCGTDTSDMSEAIRFTTTDDVAKEAIAQLNGLFNVRTQDGQVVIRNLNQLLVRNVSVHNLSGAKLADFRLDSRDDLYLPVHARHLLIFVRLQTEQGSVVYKTYLP